MAIFRVTGAWAAVRLVLRAACSIVSKMVLCETSGEAGCERCPCGSKAEPDTPRPANCLP